MAARRGLLATAAAALALAACGKKGDPLPPLRKMPQPVAGLRLAQHGDRIEASYVAPRSTTEGQRLGVLDVELLRADREGPFEKVARKQRRKAAPGESLTETWPLPPPGLTVRIAARAIAGGHSSTLTTILALKVQAPPPQPTVLVARQQGQDVVLSWTAPQGFLQPEPAPSASPGPPATPSPSASPSPPATPNPSASPSPPPKPSTGFWVYRRRMDGEYARPLQANLLTVSTCEDKNVPTGETWCYAVRTVAATDPAVESGDSNEACLAIRDITPPAAPQGLVVVVRGGAVDLSWSPSPEPDVAFYRVYRGPDRPPLEEDRLADVPAGVTSYRDTLLAPGVVYFYALTAVDKAGNESARSPLVEGGIE